MSATRGGGSSLLQAAPSSPSFVATSGMGLQSSSVTADGGRAGGGGGSDTTRAGGAAVVTVPPPLSPSTAVQLTVPPSPATNAWTGAPLLPSSPKANGTSSSSSAPVGLGAAYVVVGAAADEESGDAFASTAAPGDPAQQLPFTLPSAWAREYSAWALWRELCLAAFLSVAVSVGINSVPLQDASAAGMPGYYGTFREAIGANWVFLFIVQPLLIPLGFGFALENRLALLVAQGTVTASSRSSQQHSKTTSTAAVTPVMMNGAALHKRRESQRASTRDLLALARANPHAHLVGVTSSHRFRLLYWLQSIGLVMLAGVLHVGLARGFFRYGGLIEYATVSVSAVVFHPLYFRALGASAALTTPALVATRRSGLMSLALLPSIVLFLIGYQSYRDTNTVQDVLVVALGLYEFVFRFVLARLFRGHELLSRRMMWPSLWGMIGSQLFMYSALPSSSSVSTYILAYGVTFTTVVFHGVLFTRTAFRWKLTLEARVGLLDTNPATSHALSHTYDAHVRRLTVSFFFTVLANMLAAVQYLGLSSALRFGRNAPFFNTFARVTTTTTVDPLTGAVTVSATGPTDEEYATVCTYAAVQVVTAAIQIVVARQLLKYVFRDLGTASEPIAKLSPEAAAAAAAVSSSSSSSSSMDRPHQPLSETGCDMYRMAYYCVRDLGRVTLCTMAMNAPLMISWCVQWQSRMIV